MQNLVLIGTSLKFSLSFRLWLKKSPVKQMGELTGASHLSSAWGSPNSTRLERAWRVRV